MDKNQFTKILAEQIKEVRIKSGMTQNDVSIIMEIDSQNFSKYERGLIAPTVFWINKFCIATGKNLAEMIHEFSLKLDDIN